MNILITGSSGTIGTRLCEKLLQTDHTIYGADWVENHWNSAINDLTVQIDLRNQAEYNKLPSTIDLIIHLAANARVRESVKKPEQAADNITTTFNVLEFARKNNVPRIIFASSRETYGNITADTYTEDMVRVEECESPYTASKLAGEALVEAYSRCYNIAHLTIRFSNVYGMYDDSERVIPTFVRHALQNEVLDVYGKEKCYDFTYIDDAVHGVLQAIHKFDTVANQAFNIAYGSGNSLTNVAEYITDSLQSDSQITYSQPHIGEITRYVANITKAKQLLEYSPQYTFTEGMAKAMEWYKEYHSAQ